MAKTSCCQYVIQVKSILLPCVSSFYIRDAQGVRVPVLLFLQSDLEVHFDQP